MGVVSEVLGNHGAPHTIDWNGKSYRLSLVDQRVKSAFEKARLAKAKEALAEMKDVLTPEEFARRLDAKIKQYEDGEFEIFSKDGMAFIRTVPGMRLLLSLLIDCDQNELMGLLVAKQQELVKLVGLILRESFPGLEMQAVQREDDKPSRTWKEAAQDIKEAERKQAQAESIPDPNAQAPAA